MTQPPSWRGTEFRISQVSVTPADRRDQAEVVPRRLGVGRTAVERVEDIDRQEKVLPEFTRDPAVELDALTARVAQARVVLRAQVDVRLRPVVGVVGRAEHEERLDVLRRGYV